MAITISGENNNDKILASDGVIDSLSSLNIAGVATATTFVGNLTGNVTGNVGGNLTGNVTGNINNTTLLLQTGGYERVRITSDGHVGIATGNPQHELVVKGVTVLGNNINLPTFSAATQLAVANMSGNNNFVDLSILGGRTGRSQVKFGDQDDADVGSIQYYHSDNSINFFTNASTTRKLVIASTGNVGINDASPERTLDVVGNNAMIQIEGSGGSGKQWSLCSADNTTGAAVGTAGMFAIYNDTDGVAALRISNSNYVLRPKLPYFNCTSTPTAGSPAIHSFGNVHSNNGSHYDNSNGRFTAPVTGFYWFSCGIWCNAVASNGTHIQLMRYIQSSSSTTAFAGANHSDQYNNLNCSAGTYMESGDYVYIHQTNISVQSSTPRNFFSGYLVG